MGVGSKMEGERVGRYVIERLIARGGVGEVYAAHAEATGERVALKLLAEFSPAAAVRFEREERILRRITHPHIVARRDFGRTAEGLPYLAMELLEGDPLDALFTRGAVAPAVLVDIAIQLCEALAVAHAQGVIHRDLKPSNVFMSAGESTDARLLDFGIARLAGERALTVTGSAIGTWAYMSPEQATGERDIDARTDLWSLGALLYEGLARQLPFLADTPPAMLYKIIFEEPTPLNEVATSIPLALCTTVMRCLRKPRDDRFATAAELASALRELRPSLASAMPLATSPGAARRPVLPGETTSENRLASVAFLGHVADRVLIERLARDLGGKLVVLTGDAALVLFGTDAWIGDEPVRAVRFALLAAPAARSVGIGTGRVVRDGTVVQGAALDSAAAALGTRAGVWVDARTAEAVRHAFAIETSADGHVRVLGPMDTTGAAAPSRDGFVGRSIELAILARVVDEAQRTERPRGAVVLGAPGMGKTRLQAEALIALRRTHPRVTCIVLRGEAFRRETPFAALKDALADGIDPSVAALFALREGDPQAELDRARTSLCTVLEGRADLGPVLFVLDDAQWLDTPSRETLRWILENSSHLPLALWAFARAEARDLTLDLVPSPQLLELAPLADDESKRLLERIAPSAPKSLISRAGGNPLFLEELARWFVERGAETTNGGDIPVTIEGALMAQIDQLPAIDRDYLKRGAIFGETFWSEGVASLGGNEESLPRLRRTDLIEPHRRSRLAGTREFGFRAAMCRDVAYELWPAELRAGLHHAAGEWLSGAPDVAPAEIARHWDLAGDASRAANAYVSAAELAARAADVASTRRHVDRVLALTVDNRLRWRALVARDDALQLSGDAATQRHSVSDLEALAAELGPAERAEAQWRKCYVLRLAAENEKALAAGMLASDLAMQLALHRIAAATQIELTYLFAATGRESLARDYASYASAGAERLGDVWLSSRADAALAFVCHEAGQVLEALDLYERASAGFAAAGDRRREALIASNAASAMLDLGRVEEAAARLAAALEVSRRVGNARSAAAAQHTLGIAERMLGRLDVARAMQDRADHEAAALRHVRLRAAIAIERCYVAMAANAANHELESLAAQAVETAKSSGAAASQASAAAVALRIATRSGSNPDALITNVRSRFAETTNTLLRLELAIALLSVDGTDRENIERARSAVDVWARAVAPNDEDFAACREAVGQRFLFDGTAPEPRVRSALESVMRVLRIVG